MRNPGLSVLYSARLLLKRGKIDYLLFKYGDAFLDAEFTLRQVIEYLQSFRYTIFKISPSGLEQISHSFPQHENFEYSNFLAVNERLRTSILGETPKRLDLKQLCTQHFIKPHGVIHIGAHEGQELETYQAMSVTHMLWIEANPLVFERLRKKIVGVPNVQAVNCAVSNQNGTVTLHVTSMDLSSSILPLKHHKDIYPNIEETLQLVVNSRTLDNILQKLQLKSSDFNILNMDIQGAELLALQGAKDTLKYIDAIYTEVNYEELYEGCALIDQIDEFLDAYGFERVATTTPYHPSWGDAFYIKKPVITMSTLGNNGRFGNQLFQYAFLKIYAQEHNLRVETPTWIGQYLFGHKDPVISKQLPEVREHLITNTLSEALIPNAKAPLKNVDFWGYFQYPTQYYVPHKEYFCSLFKPIPEVETKVAEAFNRIRSRGKTIVGLHLRRGDYGDEPYFVAPTKWYKEWLRGLWETLDEPVLFIASDELEKVISDFIEYNPITVENLSIELPEAEFYPDFYLLSRCDVIAISNSLFSFVACMLNERGKIFYRPHFASQKLIPFNPWDSRPFLIYKTEVNNDMNTKKSLMYNQDFYKYQQEGSKKSAKEIIPLVIEMIRPKSVVDVGCGIGTWLSVFKDFGIKECLGIDGDYVDKKMLQILPGEFLSFDLKKPLQIDRQFDLVISLEVAEHLPIESAEVFINSLTKLGSAVLFSAAIPFQGGTGHLNEKWPQYWAQYFQNNGYLLIDCLRNKVWNNDNIEAWYAQNIFMFVKQCSLDRYPILAKEIKNTNNSQLTAIVHPKIYLNSLSLLRSNLRACNLSRETFYVKGIWAVCF